MRILEEFWYGNINPVEIPFQRQRQFDKVFKLLTRNEERLLETLNEQEKELFGFYISNHPATSYKTNTNAISLENLDKYFDKLVTTIVLVENIKEITTKKGDKMAFVSCSDETGSVDYTFFPKIWNNINIKKGNLYKIVGRVEKRYNQIQIIVNGVEELGDN